MNSAKLMHLIYASTAAPEIDGAELKAILQAARTNNSRLSVTGMLLHTGASFFQVLEGDESTLMDLFKVIGEDPRHRSVTKIIQEPIAQRAFDSWTMGFAEVDQIDLAGIEGLSDFFEQGDSLTKLGPGRAKKLLSAFAQGRWRARLEGSVK